MIDTTQFTKLLILKRHWPLSVAVALTVVAVAVPVALGLPNVYRATTKLVVERQASATAAQPSVASLEIRLQMIKQEVLSRAQLILLVDKLNLYPALREKASLDVVVDRVQRDITVTPQLLAGRDGSQSTLSFTIGYLGDEPGMVADVANELASFYVARNSALRAGQMSRNVLLLKGQMDNAQKQVDDANRQIQAYYATNAGQLPDKVNQKIGELNRTNTSLMGRMAEQSRLKLQRQTYDMQIAQLVDDQSRPVATAASTPEQRRAKLQQEVMDLKATTGQTESGPDVRILRRQIEALDAIIATAGTTGQPGDGAETSRLGALTRARDEAVRDLNVADADVARLEQQVRTLESQINSVPDRNPRLEGLSNDARAARDLFESLRRQYDQALLAERTESAHDNEEFRVLDEARPPAMPAGPNRLNLILGSLFFALVAGVGAAVLRDQLDTSFHTMDELRLFTQVPILVSIPKITTKAEKARRMVILAATAVVLVVALACVSVGAYHFAQRHIGITRLLSKSD
jgi:polysaccharide chain length determinant protein (PEP-CTERM system associated)